MSDRYQHLAGTPLGQLLVKTLGLPNPTMLERYTAGDPAVCGPILVGGSGLARDPAARQITAAGGDLVTETAEGRVTGLVFDATDLRSTDSLVALQEFFTPVMRRFEPCARIVVLGAPPQLADNAEERVVRRSLEGFTRSLGKEVGRGGTVQLVYVDPDAIDRLASTLEFLLSPKSAYVSGQVVRIGTDVAAPAFDPVERLRPLADRVALVTGAARGIGEAIARTLHRDGAGIVGVDVPQAAGDLHTLMTELGGESVLLDITSVDSPQRIARALANHHGGVDIVVHNAGITRDRKLANMSRDAWTSVLEVNVAAPTRITQELIEQGLVRANGRIVGVASIAGIAGNPGQTNYTTSKAGVIGLVDALRAPAARHGVTINAVAPGFIETAMTAKIPALVREVGRRMNSMSQGGQPVDVAETIAWLADPRSYGVTGNVVRVCGQSLLGA